jgi:hypothetical protein
MVSLAMLHDYILDTAIGLMSYERSYIERPGLYFGFRFVFLVFLWKRKITEEEEGDHHQTHHQEMHPKGSAQHASDHWPGLGCLLSG